METEIATADNRKLRGGYYTPEAVARFLCAWAIRSPEDHVLEPSCGDGAILTEAARHLLSLGARPEDASHQLHGIELFVSEADTARRRLGALGLPANGAVATGDFFERVEATSGLSAEAPIPRWGEMDAVVGNPPFLRYQSFPEAQQRRAFSQMRQLGLRPNKLTNAWVPFLTVASAALSPTGRLAMVIPAELLQVKYAEQTRAFLSRHFASVTLVAFRGLLFDGAQQEVVLVLAERAGARRGIDLVEVDGPADLPDLLGRAPSPKPPGLGTEKWLLYLLDACEIGLLRSIGDRADLTRLGGLAEVDVGVVTGKNAFFVADGPTVARHGLRSVAVPLAGRTAQLPGLIYSADEWEAQAESDGRAWLLHFNSAARLTPEQAAYVALGEAEEMNVGFKCRTRTPWFHIPAPWVPDAFLFRQIYQYPKVVLNRAGATATDTIHRVRLRPGVDPRAFATAFPNALTFAFTEVLGRSYGGGVLEIEPNEAEHLPVVPHDALDLDALDALERAGRIHEILDVTDRALTGSLALDASDARRLRAIWQKLSERRLRRKPRARRPATT